MDLQHITVKLHAADGAAVELPTLIPVLHDWICRKALPDLLLIDVADYTHVHGGPGVMLIAHQGQFSFGASKGGLDVTYANKRLAAGSTQDRLRSAIHKTFAGASLLLSVPALKGKIEFATSRLLIGIDDRLEISNTAAAFETLKPDVESVLAALYGQMPKLTHMDGDKTGLRITAETDASTDLPTLLKRIDEQMAAATN